MDSIRVLMADDHRMFRQGLRALLELEPDIQIIGESGDSAEAVDATERLEPDVVLLDVNMPGLDGVAATREILARRPTTRIIILTMYKDDQQVFQAIKNGARGYILKDVDTAEVVSAIRAVARGESRIDPQLATRLLDEFSRVWEQPSAQARSGLTDREVTILRLIARGASNKEIGRNLGYSEKTIKNAITAMFQKLGLSDRTQAAVYALNEGLVESND